MPGKEFTETGDFIVDEDNRTIFLTADGEKKVEGFSLAFKLFR